MPVGRPELTSPSASSLSLRLLRAAWLVVVGVVALFCALLLLLRFVLLPNVDSQRERIAAWLSVELGAPIAIEAIQGDWDGWNPRLQVQGFSLRDAAGGPALELPHVAATVAWTSLIAFEPRLKELLIDAPMLAVRRTPDGRIHVGGFAIDTAAPRHDSRLAEWAMRQPLIVVRDALVTWDDELRQRPQLILDQLAFRLENGFGRHRFALEGQPPPEVSGPIDVRGDLRGRAFDDWGKASGRVYVALDYADIAAWNAWIPLPLDVRRGEGALRLWFEFVDGEPGELVADIELARVSAMLAKGGEPLELDHVTGRVRWSSNADARMLATENLTFRAPGDERASQADFTLRYAVDAQGQATQGSLAAARLELAPLRRVARRLPLPEGVRTSLERLQPRGILSGAELRWTGDITQAGRFTAKGQVEGLAFHAHAPWPGVYGLSGAFEATEAGGQASISSSGGAITLPDVLPEGFALGKAQGRFAWRRADEGLELRIDGLDVQNPILSGNVTARWRETKGGPGWLDLKAKIASADATALHRYLPASSDPAARQWLRTSILAGTLDNGEVVIKGDLARFPFADGKSGTFVASAHLRQGILDYADIWPRVTDLDADVRFEGTRMNITASSARILGASVGRTVASIDDFSVAMPMLTVEGSARAPTSELLRFVELSPVAGWIDQITRGVQAEGEATLALQFSLPVDPAHHAGNARVAGDVGIVDNLVRWPGAPPLRQVSGHVLFTEHGMEAKDVAAQALGGTAKLDVSMHGELIRLAVRGTANLADVEAAFPVPLAQRVDGSTDFDLAAESRAGKATWTLSSTLKGIAVELPAPFGKDASEPRNLRVERVALPDGKREATRVDYGEGVRLVSVRGTGPTARDEGMLLLLGKAARGSQALPQARGLAVRGDVSTLDLGEWLAFAEQEGKGNAAPADEATRLQSLDLDVPALTVLSRRYDAVSFSARRQGLAWALRASAKQVEGTATWEPASDQHANGRAVVRLSRLTLTPDNELPRVHPNSPAPSTRAPGSLNGWPALDLVAEHLYLRPGDVGRLEVNAKPEGTDWRVSSFSMVNTAGRVDAAGSWRLLGAEELSRFDILIATEDTPAFLARLDLPDDVKGAPAQLRGTLSWPGSPADFDWSALSGSFNVDVGAGQFTKIDPGMGKLLGVLSLQALPRRITLDFRDVFSDGFAFDSISGHATIARGVMQTSDLALSGPAAKVKLTGEVDLDQETQRLVVNVQPALSGTVSAAAMVALLANPLVGAAVGAGTLLAQKLMKDPLDQLFAYEYTVRGSWNEPVVARVATAGTALTPMPREPK